LIKKGLGLVIVIVKAFREVVEKIGDDDEELNSEKLFMRNPLLLEQYEA